MDQEQLILILSGVLAVVSPIGIALAKKESWSTVTKVALPIIVTVIIATGYMWLSGVYAGLSWGEIFLMALGIQQLAYMTVLRKFTEWLEHNVNASSVGKHELEE